MEKEVGTFVDDEVLDELPEGLPVEESKLAEFSGDVVFSIKEFIFAPFFSSLLLSIIINMLLNILINFAFDVWEYIYTLAFALPFAHGFIADWARGHKIESVRARLLWLPTWAMIFSVGPLIWLEQVFEIGTIWGWTLLAPFYVLGGMISGVLLAWFLRNLIFMRLSLKDEVNAG